MNHLVLIAILASVVQGIQTDLTAGEPCTHLPIDLTDMTHNSISRSYKDIGDVQLSLKISTNLNSTDPRSIKLAASQNNLIFDYNEISTSLSFYAKFKTTFQRSGSFKVEIDKNTANKGPSIYINICAEFIGSNEPIQIDHEYSYSFDPEYKSNPDLILVVLFGIIGCVIFLIVLFGWCVVCKPYKVCIRLYESCTHPCKSCVKLYSDWKEFRAQRAANPPMEVELPTV